MSDNDHCLVVAKVRERLKRSKAIHVTDCGCLKSCEMLRIPYYLDSQLTDDGKVVSFTPAMLYSPETFFFFLFLSQVLFSISG
jgi:hypothetical protein